MPSPPPTLPPIRALGIELPPLNSDYSNLLQPPTSSLFDIAHDLEIFNATAAIMSNAAPAAAVPPAVPPQEQDEDPDEEDASYDEDREHGEDMSSSEESDMEYVEKDPYPWQPIKEDTTLPCEDELTYIESRPEFSGTDHAHWERETFFDTKDPDIRPLASGRIDWTVTGFNGTEEKPNKQLIMKSSIVNIGGLDWQIKMYPKGNRTEYISIYLECLSISKLEWAPFMEYKQPPLPVLAGTPKPQRRRCIAAQVSVLMYNPAEPRTNHFKSDAHQYHKHSTDFGWKYFTNEPRYTFHQRKHGQRRAILERDTLAFTAYIRIVDDPTNCLWNSSGAIFDPVLSSTTLVAFEGLSARVAAAALLFHYLPFRKWLQSASPSSPRVAAIQGMLDKFLARKLRRKHLRHHGIPHGGDIVAVLHSLRSAMEREESPEVLRDFDDVLGKLDPGHMRVCHNRLSTAQACSIKDVLKSCVTDVSPPTLLIELERQRYNVSTRKWEKINNPVKLDDKLIFAGVEYQLYSFVNPVGKLGSSEYAVFVRPAGPSSLWYGYHGQQVQSYTQKAAMKYATGIASSTSEAGRDGNNKVLDESVAYLAMYVRKDHASTAFAAPAEDKWNINDRRNASKLAERNIDSPSLSPAPGSKTPQAVVNSQHVPPRRPPPPPQYLDPMDGEDVIMSDAEDSIPIHAFISNAVPAKAKDVTVFKEINYFAGPHYAGQVLEQSDQYHGKGKLVTVTGDVYEGLFKHGKYHGHGDLESAVTGNKYSGEWKDGLQDGQGILHERESGNIYDGGWQEGRKHGKFTLKGEMTEDDKQYCQICYERDMNIAFYDCGHVLACKQCAAAITHCPICRKSIIGRLELFGVKVSMQ